MPIKQVESCLNHHSASSNMRPVNTFDVEDTTIGSFNCIEITGLPMFRILFTILFKIKKTKFLGKTCLAFDSTGAYKSDCYK